MIDVLYAILSLLFSGLLWAALLNQIYQEMGDYHDREMTDLERHFPRRAWTRRR